MGNTGHRKDWIRRKQTLCSRTFHPHVRYQHLHSYKKKDVFFLSITDEAREDETSCRKKSFSFWSSLSCVPYFFVSMVIFVQMLRTIFSPTRHWIVLFSKEGRAFSLAEHPLLVVAEFSAKHTTLAVHAVATSSCLRDNLVELRQNMLCYLFCKAISPAGAVTPFYSRTTTLLVAARFGLNIPGC